MCKNVFAVNNGIIILTFHAQALTKGCNRGRHGPVPRPVRQMRDDFSSGPCRHMRSDFSNGPGRSGKREMSSGRKNPALADL